MRPFLASDLTLYITLVEETEKKGDGSILKSAAICLATKKTMQIVE